MKAVNPYLNFPGNTEEAFNFYKSVFGGELLGLTRFKDFQGMGDMGELSESDRNKIGHVCLPLGNDNMLMATDAMESMGQSVTVGNNVSIAIEAESAEEAERLFNGLSEGGDIEMPLQKTDWAEKYGSLADKFGIRWMLNYTGDVQFEGGQA